MYTYKERLLIKKIYLLLASDSIIYSSISFLVGFLPSDLRTDIKDFVDIVPLSYLSYVANALKISK